MQITIINISLIVGTLVIAAYAMRDSNREIITEGFLEITVDVPGEKRVIYDYANNMVVYRFIHEQTFGDCFARKMTDGEIYVAHQLNEEGDGFLEQWTPMPVEVKHDEIAGDVKRMCSDVMIYWLWVEEGNIVDPIGGECMDWRFERKCIRSDGKVSCLQAIVCIGWIDDEF